MRRWLILGALLAGGAAPPPRSADAAFRALVAAEWAWTQADSGGDAGDAATVAEVANMIVHACSTQASSTTGATLRADSGIIDTLM